MAGNHDLFLGANFPGRRSKPGRPPSSPDTSGAGGKTVDWGGIIYLQDTETTITCANGRRLRIYGSPYSPQHGNWAFQYPHSKDFWGGKIPEDTDILIIHGPPRAHLDSLSLGCVYLLQELWRVQPRLHVFGHVHEGAGTEWLQFDALQDMYERVVISGGELWNLFWLVWSFVSVFFFCQSAETRRLLVNPAVVGGLRDNEARRPIKVTVYSDMYVLYKQHMWFLYNNIHLQKPLTPTCPLPVSLQKLLLAVVSSVSSPTWAHL